MRKLLLSFLVALIFTGWCQYVGAQEVKFNLKVEDTPVVQVFELIQNQSDYIILYKDEHIDNKLAVSVRAKDVGINELLDMVLEGTQLGYKIFERQIVIIPPKISSVKRLNTQETITIQNLMTISGVVTDEHGEPLPHVSVVAKGTTFGTTTGINGEFNAEIPYGTSALQFSYIGMQNMEKPILGSGRMEVVMIEDVLSVEDVIVTALGITRNEKTLTYATQRIDEAELLKSRDINFVNSLAGKVSGLNINKSSSGAGGSTKVVLRGDKSLYGSSEPLFVIDGIPMVNRKGSQPGMFGGIDQGDGLSQVNSGDIESISILKGMNASILYGSQGANGVVLITTKRGKKKQALGVNVSSSYAMEKVAVSPDLQFRYGSENGTKESWSYTKGNYDDKFVDEFFDTGSQFINSVSLSGGNMKTNVYFSYSNTDAKGIINKNTYSKNNLTFKQSTELLDGKFKLSSNVYLAHEKWNNRNPAGYYLNPLTGLYFFPRDRYFNSYKENYQLFDESRNLYAQNWFVDDHFQSNPYWIINNQPKYDWTKRVITNILMEYDIGSGLTLKARANVDYANKSFEQRHYATSNSTNVHENGRWDYERYSDQLVYVDGMISYNKQISDLDFNVFVGGSYEKSVYGDGILVNTGLRGLLYPNEFYFDNLIPAKKEIRSTMHSRLVKQAIFGNIQIGYREKIYADFSGRNDWASSLAGTGNESYFYPALGVAGVVSNMYEMPQWIDFAKIRSSIAVAANEVPFNRVNPQHTITSSGIIRNTTKVFSNLKPERLRSFELGANLRLFKGRVSYDASFYRITSTDQFIAISSPSGSGYTQYFVNAGKIVNKGYEFFLDLIPVRTSDWNWKTSFNYSSNENTVKSLHSDLTEPIRMGNNEGYDARIVPGGSIGDIYVYKFKRDELNRIILDEKSGRPLKTETTQYVGNLAARWILGWNNTIDYKNLSFHFLLSGKFGGKVVSQTEAMLDGMGVSERTAVARDKGYVEINAIRGEELVTRIDPFIYYSSIGNRNGIKEPYVYSRTNVRLSQMSLTYSFNTRKLNLPFQKASIALTANNLFFLYLKAPFDPEFVMNTGRDFQSLDNFNLPSSKSFGFTVNLKF